MMRLMGYGVRGKWMMALGTDGVDLDLDFRPWIIGMALDGIPPFPIISIRWKQIRAMNTTLLRYTSIILWKRLLLGVDTTGVVHYNSSPPLARIHYDF